MDSENILDEITADSLEVLGQDFEIIVFPHNNRLCGIYDTIPHDLGPTSDGKP